MKIGILTYHRAENYGALLQAYALKTYLQRMGHDVSFVDYWPMYHSDYFSIFPKEWFKSRNIKGKIVVILMFLLWCVPKYLRKYRLQRFMYKYFDISKHVAYVNDNDHTYHYDVVVYGSDQIWRKQNLGNVGYDKWYFGADNVSADRKITYAASMGSISVTKKDNDYVKKQMSHFLNISVREDDLQEYMSAIGVKSKLVIDPVFLLSLKDWQKITEPIPVKGRYILFYNLLNTPESVQFVNNLSKEKGIPVVEINKQLSVSKFLNKRYVSCSSVEHFLRLIMDAEFVVSNSFHGVAFSIIFEKQFYAVGMLGRSSRVKSLLTSLGIPEKYSNDGNYFDNMIIDYSIVKNRLNELITYSKDYLNSSLT